MRELLGHLLEFHRREEKPTWWRRFDRMAMEESEAVLIHSNLFPEMIRHCPTVTGIRVHIMIDCVHAESAR